VAAGSDAAGKPGDEVFIELVERSPLPAVQLIGGEADALFIVGEIAAVEQEQQLVAVVVVGCPIDGNEPARFAVEAEFFGEFATACRSRGFSAFDVAAGDVPGVFVGGVDQ
jgi:hypothetical protein